MHNLEELKKLAAIEAVKYIKNGMAVGLGTGSTAKYAIEEIGRKIQNGELKDIVGVPTSEATENLARLNGIELLALNECPRLQITIDGADEVDKNINLIKGGGGALLREKIVAQATEMNIIIVDQSKLSNYLGEKWSVPIEVLPFALESEIEYLKSIGGNAVLRRDKQNNIFRTLDNNFIVDTNFGIIKQPQELAAKLNERAGIVEHGLFLHTTAMVIAATEEGIKIFERTKIGNI